MFQNSNVMALVIEDELIRQTNLTEQELRVQIAILLFEKNILSFGQAYRMSGLNVLDFQQLLGKQKIPMHYEVEDFEKDLQNIRHFETLK
jgi:predicted HTH domain antitoxin